LTKWTRRVARMVDKRSIYRIFMGGTWSMVTTLIAWVAVMGGYN
jgi:hypothetical protein